MRFMVEVVMLPVLAHYAVCWSGHPTRLAEILRVHSGLFGLLLPDACGEWLAVNVRDFGTCLVLRILPPSVFFPRKKDPGLLLQE